MMAPPIRVLIADDHSLLRAGLRALLEASALFQVVAEAANGREAIAAVEAHRPQIVLTDIAMPVMNGLELAARVSQEFPDIKVVVLSMHADEDYVGPALQAGAVGYLMKDSATAELHLAIEAAARGESYLSPAVSRRVIADYVRLAGSEPRTAEILTARQSEILRLIALGRTTKAIARTLGISVKTVESHRAQVMQRLAIFDLAGLVRHAIRTGLARLDE
jgi:DNA-binding NarL/FixJ family response regulator